MSSESRIGLRLGFYDKFLSEKKKWYFEELLFDLDLKKITEKI